MRNDIERAVDTVLSGLTVDAARQEQLIRRAAQPEAAKPRPGYAFSLSPVRTAAVVLLALLILVLPLLRLPQKDFYVRYSSEDGQDYFITSNTDPTPSAGAIADPVELEEAQYQGTSFEEAAAVYGSDFPRLTWLPEGAKLEMVIATTIPELRIADIRYKEPAIFFSAQDHVLGEIGNFWVPQDDVGEYRTLSNGQEVYITTNYGKYSIVWQKGLVIYHLFTEASLEDALRMVESVR